MCRIETTYTRTHEDTHNKEFYSYFYLYALCKIYPAHPAPPSTRTKKFLF